MTRACPYWGSSSWRNPCWWYLDYPWQQRCGMDAPCVYDDETAESERRMRINTIIPFGILALIIGVIIAAAI